MICTNSFASLPAVSLASWRRVTLAATAVLLSAVVGSAAMAADTFEFEPNDVVAIYGNGLADRMQHDPWVEAVL